MGGILAVFGDTDEADSSRRLEAMIGASPHRGTTSRAYAGGAAVATQSLGWDASLARAGNLIVALHGYVGNWLEIRELWKEETAATDAEKVAAAFRSAGPSAFARFRGQFACVIWDVARFRAYLFRDLSGGRPLFLSTSLKRTVVATMPRLVLVGQGLESALDTEVLVGHMLQKPVTTGGSLYRGIREVSPMNTEVLEATTEMTLSVSERWVPPERESATAWRRADISRELAETVTRAVARCLPTGPFSLALSSGHDSGLIWGCLRHLAAHGMQEAAHCRPVTMHFPGSRLDESLRVGRLLGLFGCSGDLVDVSSALAAGFTRALDGVLDCPGFPNLSIWTRVAEHLAESRIRIQLTGCGGDHLFTGHAGVLPDVMDSNGLRAYGKALSDSGLRGRAGATQALIAVARALLPSWARRIRRRRQRPEWLSRSAWEGWYGACGRALADGSRPGNLRRGELLGDLQVLQHGLLWQYWGGIGAAAGIETRSPFVDQDVIEFAFRIPSEVMGTWGRGRRVVSEAARQLMPEAAVDGFFKAPFDEGFEGATAEVLEDLRARRWQLVDSGVLDENGVGSLARRAALRPRDYSQLLYLFPFELFARRFAA